MSPRHLVTPPASWTTRGGPGYVVHVAPSVGEDARLAFALAFARGFDQRPRSFDPRYLYDHEGSTIFEAITTTPEYYQTRTEDALLARVAPSLRATVGDVSVAELGSGSSSKTRRILSAFAAAGPLRYLPIDISPGALEPACQALAAAYPGARIEGLASSWDRALPLVAEAGPLLVLFLGSSIGNLDLDEHDRFFERLAARLRPDDSVLIGIDLVKDACVLEAAYNDAAGHSARFTLNLFARANRELDAGIPLDALEHVAFYDERHERIEIYARAVRGFDVHIPLLDRRLRVAGGELMRTEISCKYRPDVFAARAARFGFTSLGIERDEDSLFAVVLLRRRKEARQQKRNAALAARLDVQLRRVRLVTEEIVSSLPDDALARQHHPLMGPIGWDLGHIAAFEALWLGRALDVDGDHAATDAADGTEEAHEPRGEGLPERFDAIRTPRAVRGSLVLPSRRELLDRLEEVRRASLLRLGQLREELSPRTPGSTPDAARPSTAGLTRRERLLDGGYVYRMVAQHEAQHQETMLQAVQLREDLVFGGALAAPPPRPGPRPGPHLVLVPAGPFLAGTDDARAAYDNERPAHLVELPAFRIEAAPVTNGEYLAFVEDGGYKRPELWSDAGRAWLAEARADGPLHWRVVEGMRMALIFGEAHLLDHDRPVVHVSYYEAEAYARWRGRRLPTEHEWEKAAAWDPERGAPRRYPWGDERPTPAHANLDARLFEPAPIGSYPLGQSAYGCHQMVGDVWEWTSSPFVPYPGFEAFPYREYSEVFFGGTHRVLRGGSWATSSLVARCSFRNWDFPQRRQIFSGLRCVEDV